MEFCPICGNVPVKLLKQDGRVCGICRNGHIFPVAEKSFVVVQKNSNRGVKTSISSYNPSTFGYTEHCPHCGTVAHSVATRLDRDFSLILVYQCPKCGYRWAE